MTPEAEVAGQIERAYRGYHVWVSDEGWWYATKVSPRARGQSLTVHGRNPDELTTELSAEEGAALEAAERFIASIGG